MSILGSPELHILVSYVDIRPNKEMGAIHDPWQLIPTTCNFCSSIVEEDLTEFPGYQLVKDVVTLVLTA